MQILHIKLSYAPSESVLVGLRMTCYKSLSLKKIKNRVFVYRFRFTNQTTSERVYCMWDNKNPKTKALMVNCLEFTVCII